jgi:putative acetyltransferase
MEIRLFQIDDADQVAQLFYDTVHHINCRDYSPQQIQAWAPDNTPARNWVTVCSSRFTYVALRESMVLGFAELELNGHIDCFYCHQDYQRCGVGRSLYQVIETKALELELERIFTEASITAKPFFERMGFSVVQEQQVSRRGEVFTNFAMQKILYVVT